MPSLNLVETFGDAGGALINDPETFEPQGDSPGFERNQAVKNRGYRPSAHKNMPRQYIDKPSTLSGHCYRRECEHSLLDPPESLAEASSLAASL